MLRSLEFHSGFSLGSVLHDDGHLERQRCRRNSEKFPRCRHHPAFRSGFCGRGRALRLSAVPQKQAEAPWFLKVFDTRHFAHHDRYIVIDSDIVFFRRPDLVLDWMEKRPETFWFMEDAREKYSPNRAGIEAVMGFPIWERVNSGLDLLVSSGRGSSSRRDVHGTLCPACQRVSFSRTNIFCRSRLRMGKGGKLPPEYEISWTNFRRRGAVCRHYIGPSKNDTLFIEGATSFGGNPAFPSRPAALNVSGPPNSLLNKPNFMTRFSKAGALAYRQTFATISTWIYTQSADLLEIGCGGGHLLKSLKCRSRTGHRQVEEQLSKRGKSVRKRSISLATREGWAWMPG